MSSRRANARALRETRGQNASADRTLDQPDTRAPSSTRKTRGRQQPQGVDFQVTSEMPEPLPISDKELRAIEVLLGDELLNLLGNDANDS